MIIIFSNCNDKSTNEVIHYLKLLNKEYILVDDSIQFSFEKIDEKEFLKCGSNNIDLENITSVWYRRASFNIVSQEFQSKNINSIERAYFYYNVYINDRKKINEYFSFLLKRKNVRMVNYYEDYSTYRIINFEIAKDCGLLVPKYFFINSIKELNSKLNSGSFIVPKFIGDGLFYINNNTRLDYHTTIIKKTDLRKLQSINSTTLIQEYIEKYLELRVFFLNQKLYPAAIFSQLDATTKIDFRNYNIFKQNRVVPYKFPRNIEKAIFEFINTLKLTCGSLDMILSKDQKYYFLEVNPVGQFEFISYKCNLNLEHELAKSLIQISNEKEVF